MCRYKMTIVLRVSVAEYKYKRNTFELFDVDGYKGTILAQVLIYFRENELSLLLEQMTNANG